MVDDAVMIHCADLTLLRSVLDRSGFQCARAILSLYLSLLTSYRIHRRSNNVGPIIYTLRKDQAPDSHRLTAPRAHRGAPAVGSSSGGKACHCAAERTRASEARRDAFAASGNCRRSRGDIAGTAAHGRCGRRRSQRPCWDAYWRLSEQPAHHLRASGSCSRGRNAHHDSTAADRGKRAAGGVFGISCLLQSLPLCHLQVAYEQQI